MRGLVFAACVLVAAAAVRNLGSIVLNDAVLGKGIPEAGHQRAASSFLDRAVPSRAARVLPPSGCVEPWITPVSRICYRWFHQEDCHPVDDALFGRHTTDDRAIVCGLFIGLGVYNVVYDAGGLDLFACFNGLAAYYALKSVPHTSRRRQHPHLAPVAVASR